MDIFGDPLPLIILCFALLLALYDHDRSLARRNSLLLPMLIAVILGLYVIIPPPG